MTMSSPRRSIDFDRRAWSRWSRHAPRHLARTPAPPPGSRRCPCPGSRGHAAPTACGSISRMRSGPTSSSPGTSFAGRSLLERIEATQLRLVEGDDQLARVLDRHVVGLAVGLQVRLALAAQSRLERARLVVETSVQDAAVVARLVRRDHGLLLEQHHAQPGPLLEQAQGRGQTHDAGADDGDISAIHRRVDHIPLHSRTARARAELSSSPCPRATRPASICEAMAAMGRAAPTLRACSSAMVRSLRWSAMRKPRG